MRRNLRPLTWICLFTLLFSVPLSAQSDDNPLDDGMLRVVWAEDGDLLTWDSTTQAVTTLVSGDVLAETPALSPDGARVAFTRTDEQGNLSLWTVTTDGDGTAQQHTEDPIAWRRWVDADTLYINLLAISALGARPGNDILRLDVTTQDITPLSTPESAEGLLPTLSPAGTRLLAIAPGIYGEREAVIYAADLPDATDFVPVFRFPAVATGSHIGHFPPLRWLDDDTVRVLVHDADALYNALDANAPPSALWQIDLTGAAEPEILVQIETTFPANAGWSADGTFISTSTRGGLPRIAAGFSIGEMLLTPLTEGDEIALGEVLLPPLWLADSTLLVATVDDATETVTYRRIDPTTPGSTPWATFPITDVPAFRPTGPLIILANSDELAYTSIDTFNPKSIIPFERLNGAFSAVFIPK